MKNLSLTSSFKYLLLSLGLLLFMGCKVELAPQYDAIIVENTTASATKTFTFFSALDKGTSANTFAERKNTYNALIGEFETLALQAKARPIPSNKSVDKMNKLLNIQGKTEQLEQYPSAFAFKRIAENLKKMKDKDQKDGLKPFVVSAFKGEILIFLDQAFTYESFLKR